MGTVEIRVMGYKCERCGYEWVPRTPRNVDPKAKKGETPKPRICPKCKSALWDVPPKKPKK